MTTFTPLLLPKVLDGSKNHTYRQRHEGDRVSRDAQGCIVEIRDAKGRLKWKVGKRYSVQPGRGQKGVGFYVCTGLDECADVRHIDDAMARREGFASKLDFMALWTTLYDKLVMFRARPDLDDDDDTFEFLKTPEHYVDALVLWYELSQRPAARYGPVWGISFEVVK